MPNELGNYIKDEGGSKMKIKFILIVAGLLLVLFSYSSAQVPQLINYQGKLTKSTGAPLDTTISIVFTIYNAEVGGIALWIETQSTVVVDKGIFNVLLGSTTPVPDSVFDGTIRYLGVTVGGDPEIIPRKPMVSVPYAYRAGSGGGSVNCHSCDSVFVNVVGPDSVYSTSGTAFKGSASGSSGSEMVGVRGYADNTSTGPAYGGYFITTSYGTGTHYGVRANGLGSSSAATYGYYGYADNTSTGAANGGFFSTSSSGTGVHYGVYGTAYGNSSSPVYGSYWVAENTSTGIVYGGIFFTSASGTGPHYGVKAAGLGSSSATACGSYGYAENTSTGTVYGGLFETSSSGTGLHYGVRAEGFGSSSTSTYGCYGYADNPSTGSVYAGYFYAASNGTGPKYGVYASAPTAQGYAGYFAGDVRITDSLIVLGGKSAAVKVDNGEYRLLYSQESPENWFEDFGEGKLMNGNAHIELDPVFLQTVTINSQHPMKVFIQLNDPDCKGTAVIRGTTGFDVVELQNGTSNASFTYRVVVKRKGYENLRLAKMGGPTPEEVAMEQAKHQAEMEKERIEQQKERKQREAEQSKMNEDRVRMEKE